MKTVLITGVGKGLGKALSEKFLTEGYFVIGTYYEKRPENKENLALFELDLSSSKSIENCIKEIKKLSKTIDILINNAAVLLDNEETSVKIEKLRNTLEVNLIGTIDFTEKLLESIKIGGHIVDVSSSAGSLQGMKHFEHSHAPYRYPAYKISKTALNMYTCTLALRMNKEGMDITVSSVNPGWIRTDMGGADADLSPEESAENIFKLAISKPETGGFWYKGERMPW